jgi:hypothetical protein
LHLGETWERTGERTVAGEIELVQRSTGVTAAVGEVLGNVISSVSTAGSADSPLEVADDRPSAAGGIAITAARCDPMRSSSTSAPSSSVPGYGSTAANRR